MRNRTRFGGVSVAEGVSALAAGDAEDDAEGEDKSLFGAAPLLGKPWRTAHGSGARDGGGCDMARTEFAPRSERKRTARFEPKMR